MPLGEGPGPDRPNNRPKAGGPSLKMPSRGILSWMIFLGLALMLVVLLTSGVSKPEPIDISTFWNYVQNGQVDRVRIREDSIAGTRKRSGGDTERANLEFELQYPAPAMDSQFMRELRSALPDASIKFERRSQLLITLVSLLPWLLLVAFFWFFVFRQLRNAGGGGVLGNFGRSRHRVTTKEHTNVTFADVAGITEAKEEVQEVIEFLKNPKKFQRLGGRIPRGVLLVGQPGCGKTLLAKAIAGEAVVPFFSISGSDFVEMFVGVGASRVRDLFKQAKDNSPCIIFLDEIDAVGRRRGASFAGGGHDEREQTLNAILVEMDGFDTDDQVIVIAATNRVDVLDPALIRPGRFDRQVYVALPDVKGRYEILKVHARKIKLGPNVDLKRLARGTPMFSGADLAAIINEAALLATMQNKEFVEQEDLEEGRDKVRWGRAKRSRDIDEKERWAIACHEAGHALVQSLSEHADPVHKISIIPRGPFGGATFSLPEKDRSNLSKNYILAIMRVLCAGRISEEHFCGDVNTGAAADIRQATELARRMITEWGMNEKLGFIAYDGDDAARNPFFDLPGAKEYSEQTAQLIDQEIRRLIDEAYRDAEKIIQENAGTVKRIAAALIKYETITGEDVKALIAGESLDKPAVADLLDEEAQLGRHLGQARPVPAPERTPQGEPGFGGGPLPQPG
ncbi:MAG: ATP-dependent zinc metalloprotease FtsH [Planctomycetota bacterium]